MRFEDFAGHDYLINVFVDYIKASESNSLNLRLNSTDSDKIQESHGNASQVKGLEYDQRQNKPANVQGLHFEDFAQYQTPIDVFLLRI